jgi:hypothetical protein
MITQEQHIITNVEFRLKLMAQLMNANVKEGLVSGS